MTNLVALENHNIVAKGKLLIGFYDKVVEKKVKNKGTGVYDVKKETVLFVNIVNGNDKHSVIDRKAGERKHINRYGEVHYVDETKLYAEAYGKYIAAKNLVSIDNKEARLKELELEAKIEALEAKKVAKKEAKKFKPVKLEESKLEVKED
jgi:hypothetical protein